MFNREFDAQTGGESDREFDSLLVKFSMITSSKWLSLVVVLCAIGCTEIAPPATSIPIVPPGLASLSPEDRALVEKQKNCPVTGELLGSRDEPLKMMVSDRVFFVCCPGCYGQVLKDPQKYLALLNPSTTLPDSEAPAKP